MNYFIQACVNIHNFLFVIKHDKVGKIFNGSDFNI